MMSTGGPRWQLGSIHLRRADRPASSNRVAPFNRRGTGERTFNASAHLTSKIVVVVEHPAEGAEKAESRASYEGREPALRPVPRYANPRRDSEIRGRPK